MCQHVGYQHGLPTIAVEPRVNGSLDRINTYNTLTRQHIYVDLIGNAHT